MDQIPENNPVPEVIDVSPTGKVEKVKVEPKPRFFWPFILIAVGIIFLVQNLDLVKVHLNWWAAFIFIPVVGSLATAVGAFRKSGRFDSAVRGALGSVVVVGTVATMLLFGVDWSRFWPLMLIAPGISAVLTGLSFADAEKHPSLARWEGLSAWFGLGMILVGVGFLAKFMPIPSIEAFLFNRWWAVPILVVGAGVFINAIVVCAQNSFKPGWTVWGFTIIGIVFTATGLFALLNLNWNLLGPIILIGAGIVVLSGILIKK